MVDVTSQINSVQRKLGSRVVEAGEAVTATVSQVYDTGLDDLWDACTNPERIPRWFLPVSGDLRAGGKYQLEGNAGGTVERCDPPKSFAATWEYGGDVSWVEVRLSAEPDGRTRFELDHTAVPNEHWKQFGPGAVGIGWDMMLNGLALHLESGETSDPAAAMAWMTSEDGVRFMTLSSEAWYEADVANGTGAATARTRADATLAAYTAPSES
ncbi:SRPBCC family protein [Amycolatopsis sp. NPDC051071]|uniref:SRPBCC family protein n=1 Tax=Amycolatopsis sp. NPDC051071 TaxID=3154637 RepID=UPI0034447CBB